MSKKALYRALLIRVQRPAVICSTRTDYQQNNSSHNWTTKICPDKFVIEMLKKRWVFSSDDLMLTEKILMIVRNEFQNRFNNLIERLSLQRDLMGNSTPPSTWEGVELTTMFTHIHEQKPATVLRGQHLWNHDINRQFEKNKPTWGAHHWAREL